MSEIDDILNPILLTFRERLRTFLTGHAITAYLRGSAEMVSYGQTQLGLPVYFEGPPMQQAIDWANEHCARLVTQMNEETKNLLAKVISDGIEKKRGIDGLARDIRKQFDDMSKVRSQTIARTETAEALEQAFMDRSEDMGITGKEWIVTIPCEACEENGGAGIIPINQAFPSGHMRPPAHPNCLLPDNEVLPLGLVGMSRAYYSGQIIELHTRSGYRLTITPNHPILCPRGFVLAKELREGDYIISSPNSKRMIASINPNYDYIPIPIEQIWNSLDFTAGMSRMSVKVASIDFHGDAGFFDGDVDIVNTNRFLLGDIINPFNFEFGNQHIFNHRYAKPFNFSSFSSLLLFGDRVFPSPHSFMGIGSKTNSFSRRQFAHSDNIGLATIPRSNPSPEQSSADNTSVYSKLSSQFLLRFTSLIAPEQIIKVRDFNYSGHVYDLQTLEQLYIANNIIVKNCRCALAPVMLPK